MIGDKKIKKSPLEYNQPLFLSKFSEKKKNLTIQTGSSSKTKGIPQSGTKTNKYLPIYGKTSAKISPRISLTNTIKSMSKGRNKENKENNTSISKETQYIPALTENVDILKYQRNPKTSNKPMLFANPDKVKISHKNLGVIQSYAAITNEGRRDYNEDRVSIIYNISKPQSFIETKDHLWPKCSFFGLYDGHGGDGCSDFLRDNLHNFIIGDPHFPSNPNKALVNGFIKAENYFIKNCVDKHDFSGSCAIVVLIIEQRCYVVNVGDSRAILSRNNGLKISALSKDHRPGEKSEYDRIIKAGGKIYQMEYENKTKINSDETIIGPLRVLPGKLSVSRTIGDIEAKKEEYGGNPKVVIATPEIKYFDIVDSVDFILIGCDGVYEKMKNKQIIDNMWNIIKENEFPDIHNLSGVLLEKAIEECLARDSTDNLTMIMICLKDLETLKKDEFHYCPAQTENIEPLKQKGNNLAMVPMGTNSRKTPQRQPLKVLLTKLVHNNTNTSGVNRLINRTNTFNH
ncbi:MAG: protein phosphatase 2C domain-containing protein [archaeon]|nr:protein phosphatase 2C domain-containing protein [archaeon]